MGIRGIIAGKMDQTVIAQDNTAPAVSVLMAVYNGSRWLGEAIESVLGQTFTDFEFIIVNDGSTDDSLNIIQKYANQDSRIVLVSKENTGVADSANCGLHLANGKLVARMDADDICKPYRLHKQVAFLKAHPEVALVSGAMEYIDENGAVFGRTYPITSQAAIRHRILQHSNVIVQPAVTMRRDTAIDCGGYCSGLTMGEDAHLWLKMIRKGYLLAVLPEPVIAYRVRGMSLTSQKKSAMQERLTSEIFEYDTPPEQLLEAYRKEVEKNKGRFTTAESRKEQVAKTLHCKLWRVGKTLGIPEKVTERLGCSLQNTLATIRCRFS
ncbi:MAG: glycosyltransferase [Salinivirgaceae bacterium]|nr:glycosyltransferase [Salinivirgaceae bacterium]